MTVQPVDAVGYLGAALVLVTFCMRSMGTLRLVAICSNVAFISYGYFGRLPPVLLLHALLLPINIYRLLEPSPRRLYPLRRTPRAATSRSNLRSRR